MRLIGKLTPKLSLHGTISKTAEVIGSNVQPLTVRNNGTYEASNGVDGFNPVYVNTPEPKEEQEKVVDITENGTTEVLPDENKVLSKVTVNVEVAGGEYIEYPLPQDDYVYYRYPPCNEERYIYLGVNGGVNPSTIEYGTLNANGYTKVGTMDGVKDGTYYEFNIPAHKEDFIIKLSAMPIYGRSNAVCTEVVCGESAQGLNRRANAYAFAAATINGLKKITVNKSIGPAQMYGMFRTLPCETIKFKTANSIQASYNIFTDCIFLKEVQFEEMILSNPYDAFRNCASLETIDCSKIVPSGRIDNMFNGCSSLEILDLSSWATQSLTFTNVGGLFRYCGKLKTLNLSGWDLSHLTSVADWLDGNPLLEDVILDNTTLFSASFGVSKCLNLTPKSLTAIFKALPQLPQGTTKTLTLHANQQILQSQVDSANAIGWTIAGGTVVSEEEYYG